MKKSTLLALSGIIVVFLVIMAMGNKSKVYEKQERYKNPEDAIVNFIGYINSYEVVKDRSIYYNIIPNEFLESISRRYRLYINEDNMNKWILGEVPILYSYELSEINKEDLNYLITSYESSYDGVPNYKKPVETRYYKLDAVGSYNENVDKTLVKSNGTVDKLVSDKDYDLSKNNIEIYLIVVDEGEGYVVDYYNTISK
ncbi:hypothetical protein UT300007_02560 [Clostridium sp. CTA-7]